MNKLLIVVLSMLFIFSGAGLASAGFLTMVLSGIIPIDHVSLFCLCCLLTYNFYGLVGLLYIILNCIALIACSIMWWYDLSFNDLNKMYIDCQSSESESVSEFNKKIDMFNQYKSNGSKKFYEKLGLTEKKIAQYTAYCSNISNKFDVFCCIVCKYLGMFCEMTRDVPGLRTVYYLVDQVIVWKENVDAYRTIHKAHNPFSDMHETVAEKSENADPLSLNALIESLGNLNAMDRSHPDNDELSPEQKKQLDDMMSNMTNMMSLFGTGMGNHDGFKQTTQNKK
jgi:hypothetical protein